MSLKGKLETFYMSSLFQFLANDEKTGILTVTDAVEEVNIFLKEGVIVFATSSQDEYRLGNYLKKRGIVSDETLETCLQFTREEKRSLGKILVLRGYLTREQFKEILHEQVREILYNVLLWKKGEFEYKDVAFNIEGKLITEMNTTEVLLEASRRIDEWSVLQEQIPSDKVALKLTKLIEEEDEAKLGKNERRILNLIMDGTKTVRQLIDETGYDEFASYKVIYSLMLSGLIEREEDEKEEGMADFDYEGMITIYFELFQVLQKHLGTELGKNVFALFDECKADLDPEHAHILRAFEFQKPVKQNIETLAEGFQKYENQEEKRQVLMGAFNALLASVLGKGAKILGVTHTESTIKEARQILGSFQEYQKEAAERRMVIRGIGEILDKSIEKSGKKPEKVKKLGSAFSLGGK
jgi:hypothetical protein